MMVGRPGQVEAAMPRLRVPKVGSGVVRCPHHLPPPPVIGETQNPVAVCPTGAALRPTNKRGVSGKPGWTARSQAPEGNRREWHREDVPWD